MSELLLASALDWSIRVMALAAAVTLVLALTGSVRAALDTPPGRQSSWPCC